MRSRPLLVVPFVACLVPALVVLGALGALGCGSGRPGDGSGANAPATPKDASDAGVASAASGDAAPAGKPFAGSAAEATQLIGAAIEQGAAQVQKCVAEYRTRKNMPHERVTISMGIDQDGRLLGATLPKGKADPVLSGCVQAALANAPFPRSHSGVISITKSYEEIVQ